MPYTSHKFQVVKEGQTVDIYGMPITAVYQDGGVVKSLVLIIEVDSVNGCTGGCQSDLTPYEALMGVPLVWKSDEKTRAPEVWGTI